MDSSKSVILPLLGPFLFFVFYVISRMISFGVATEKNDTLYAQSLDLHVMIANVSNSPLCSEQ